MSKEKVAILLTLQGKTDIIGIYYCIFHRERVIKMGFTTVLFDLDGTLLPMDLDLFTHTYFKGLCAKMAPFGYSPDRMIAAVWAGTKAMIQNDGSRICADVFWEQFVAVLGEDIRAYEPELDEFYRVEFQNVQKVCGFNPASAQLVRDLKNAGYRVALATNPLFPPVATESRIRWAGLEPEEFELVTTYDNSSYCKPNPAYYQEILSKLGVTAEECIMVGNDVKEDMVAASELGITTFLLTDCLLNKDSLPTEEYPQGSFAELRAFLRL